MILVVYGETDRNAPSVRSACRLPRLWQDTKHPDATLRVLPRTGHGLWDPESDPHRPALHPDLVRLVAEWVGARI